MSKSIFVYCARSWRVSTALATLSLPLTCPPVTMANLDTGEMAKPLLYIRLHGMPGQPYLYGDDFITALSREQVCAQTLPRSLVFLEGCYGMQFAKAFLEAGASVVIGSYDPTMGKRWFPGGSTKIGLKWLALVRMGMNAGEALSRATAGDPRAQWMIAGNRKERLIA